MITVAHAEVLIPICDLSLDITPEGGGFHYRITDLRSKCLVQTEGGLFVSFDNAKCKAAAAARRSERPFTFLRQDRKSVV